MAARARLSISMSGKGGSEEAVNRGHSPEARSTRAKRNGKMASQHDEDEEHFGIFAFDSELARSAFLAQWERRNKNKREQMAAERRNHSPEAREMAKLRSVKVEAYDRTYDCLICGVSARGRPVLHCSQCRNFNPVQQDFVKIADIRGTRSAKQASPFWDKSAQGALGPGLCMHLATLFLNLYNKVHCALCCAGRLLTPCCARSAVLDVTRHIPAGCGGGDPALIS